MSLMRKAGPLMFARLIGAGLTFTIPLVLARAMNLEEYGTYKQLFLIAQTLFYVLPFGVAQSLYFFLPRAEHTRAFVAQTLLFVALAGVAGGVAIFGFGDGIASLLQNPGILAYRWELAIYVAGLVASLPLEITLTSQGKTKQAAIVYLGSDALRAVAMVAPVFMGYGLRGAMVAMAAWSVLRVVATWASAMAATQGPLLQGGLMGRQLLYAAPFGAAMLLSIPQQYAHQYAVGATVPPEVFALYAVGCFQLPLVDLLYTPTSEVLMVRVGELEREGRVREAVGAFKEASGKLAYALLPMAAFLFVAAPEFVTALFGSKFIGSVPIFRVSVLAVALSILPMDGILRARNETRYLFFSYLVKALVTVPLVWIGVTRFGLMGGILSWAGAEVVGKATLLARVPRSLGHTEGSLLVRIGRVLPWRDLGNASLAAVGAGVGVAVLRVATEQMWMGLPEGFVWRAVPLTMTGVLFGMGYLALLRATGVRPWSVLASLRRRPA